MRERNLLTTAEILPCVASISGNKRFIWKSFEEINSSYAIPTALQKIKQKAKEKAN